MKKLLVIVFVFVLTLITGCSNQEQVEEVTEKEEVVTEEIEEVSVSESADVSSSPSENSNNNIDTLEQEVLNGLNSNMEFFEVTFNKDEKVFLYDPIQERVPQRLYKTLEGDMDDWSYWHGIINNFRKISETVQKYLGDGYKLVVINPSDESQAIIIVGDGTIIYDWIEEQIEN
ncbi:hypothetical protein F9U64_21995 [Gracilibacillus oryzae]|uniref:Uncharacterized protein n=1 Tax=Gracilibacillus oryzae TaxID=1672701 RepID=A0A7C8KRS8_9BACI|nr:hypothetical protein [Gracilibacillus oryzae]KAB8125706.1 hypothetical protein F9U64_21995 [Gracilibacillus oryzae]